MYNVHLICHCTYLMQVIVFEKLHIVKSFILYNCYVRSYFGYFNYLADLRNTMANPNSPRSMAILG